MIKANEARKSTSTTIANARTSKIFKHAIKRLEEDIIEATKNGKSEICFNISYFNIRPFSSTGPFSSIEKDIYATEADRQAIRDYMVENGYEFYFYSAMNIAGRFHNCFVCKW